MIRVAPSSAARRIGVLVATAPSMNRRSSICTGGKMPGIAVLARMASTTNPLEKDVGSP